MPRPKAKSPFLGRFRISWMESWDLDIGDDQTGGYFEFSNDGSGEFHFGCVHGQIDYRPGTRDGEPSVDFSWEGNDDMDAASGGGWAVIDGNEMEGMLFFHQGEQSAFRAKRKK